MSRLQELMAELCPDGVEYKVFSNLCSYTRGVTFSKPHQSDDESDRAVLRANNIDLASNTLCLEDIIHVDDTVTIRDDQILRAGDIFICAGSGSKEHVGKVAYIDSDTDYAFGGFMAAIRCQTAALIPRFLYFFLTSEAFAEHRKKKLQASTINNLNAGVMASLNIPVPPIEVQREVVRILDEYTAAHDELARQLEEEMGLREQQLSIARFNLLEAAGDIETVALGELCRVGRGTYITGKQVIPGEIPVILGGMEPAYYHNVANHEGEAIVVSRSGVNAGYASFWDEPIFVSDGFVVDNPRDGVSLPYVFQALRAKQQEMIGMNRGSGVPHITGKMLANVSIPVPSYKMQAEIVRIIGDLTGAFYQLAHDLSNDLTLCDQQLSLVRNQLLSFPEKVA